MIALTGLILFAAALAAVMFVLVSTLLPALPRMAALLAGDRSALAPLPAVRVRNRDSVQIRVDRAGGAWRMAA